MSSAQSPEPQIGSYAPVGVNPGRILRAIARIGYTPQSAICDIVDNSVAAGARKIAIHLEREPDIAENRRNSAARYIIADDGSGMDPDELVAALSLGVERDYDQGSLSKFGLGLKSASLSQGDRLEIVSRSEGDRWHKVVLDLPHVEAVGRLECQLLAPTEDDEKRRAELLPNAERGTIVTVEKIHKKNHPSIRKTRAALHQMLGVIYFYFLQGSDSMRVLHNPPGIGIASLANVFDPGVKLQKRLVLVLEDVAQGTSSWLAPPARLATYSAQSKRNAHGRHVPHARGGTAATEATGARRISR
jgi:hypothetical protein